MAHQAAREQQEAQRRVREHRAIEQWKAEKTLKDKQAEEQRVKEEQAMEELKAEKQRKCNAAFLAWKREKESASKENTANFAPHSHRWIDIVSPVLRAPNAGPPKRGKAKQPPQELLSPPHLYKDYCMYEEMAPNYKVKYPSQVASGGVGLCLNSFETRLCPPPPEPKAKHVPISGLQPKKRATTATSKRASSSLVSKSKQ
ncbi:hypothetical protein HDU98_010698 [Podochytrium sp. JEL0797]|nr:hypothetical protein HDU98_010698 [Podochytrium sp. JEL0797]